MAYDNTRNHGGLETLQNLAYTGAHLLSIQMMRQSSPPSDKINVKPEIFYFLTLAPGAGSGSSRTYDFTAKINIKFSIVEILSLSFALHCAAIGNLNAIIGYNKFAKSTDVKSVSIGIANKTSKYGDQRTITLFVSCGKTRYAFGLDCATASSISKQLEWSGKTATDLEMSRMSNTVTIDNPRTQYQPQQPQQHQPQQQPQPQYQNQRNG